MDNFDKIQVFQDIYAQNYNIIFSYIYRHTNNLYSAQDMAQDVFLTAFIKLEKLYNFPKQLAWIYRCSNIMIKRYWKKLSEENNIFDKEISITSINIMSDIDIFIFEDFKVFLSNKEITILKLKYELKYINKEIAQMYNTTSNLINVEIYRIKNKIKKFIEIQKI